MEAGLYIHIPFCLSKCSYCDFFSIPSPNVPDSYVQALVNEISEKTKDVTVKSVYMGGGTPSLLTKEQLDSICNAIPISEDTEFTIEVNPDDVTKDFLENLSKTKVSRISCGIQSFCEKSLSYCHRRASKEQNDNALNLFARHWKKELSLDLICAMPYEDIDSLKSGLMKVCNSGASAVSFYSLTIEEETPLGQDVENGRLDYDYDSADNMWLEGRKILEEQGFSQYEVSNFCRPGHECRHNLIYWNHENYLGCGSGAVETIYNIDGSGVRRSNTQNIQRYIDYWLSNLGGNDARRGTVEENLPYDEELVDVGTSVFEYFMMGMRKLSGITREHYKKQFGTELPESFVNLVNKWKKKGLAVSDGERFALNGEGILYLNTFLSELDV